MPETSRARMSGIVDCDIHAGMASLGELEPFLPERWRRHLKTYGPQLRQVFANTMSYPRIAKDTARADAWPPSGRPPGTDLDFMRAQHLDPLGIKIGILQPLRPGAASERNPAFGAALASAINDWQIAAWLEPEPRLRGSIVVAQDDPESAVAEIARRAEDPRFVQVALAPKSLEPLGRPRYHPILAAAAEAGLPLGLHVSGVSGHAIAAGGWPSFYAEDHNSNVAAMQATVTSLIFEGATARWPDLRIVLIEGGIGWEVALRARLDRIWREFRDELPDLGRPPSEHLAQQFLLTTQPIEEPPDADLLLANIEAVGLGRLLFASDYPHWDSDDPTHVAQTLPVRARQAVLRDNAMALYRLPAGAQAQNQQVNA